MITIPAILEAKLDEGMGYVTYVFRNPEETRWNNKYKMVTRCPNWNHRVINIGEEGYLTYDNYIAGESTWYNGSTMQYYRYTMSQFLKFISKPKQITTEYIM